MNCSPRKICAKNLNIDSPGKPGDQLSDEDIHSPQDTIHNQVMDDTDEHSMEDTNTFLRANRPHSDNRPIVQDGLSLATCNIEGIRSNNILGEHLLDLYDIVLLQEHWLYGFEQNYLLDICVINIIWIVLSGVWMMMTLLPSINSLMAMAVSQ